MRRAAPLVLALFAGCNAILGNEESYTLVPPPEGHDCILTSDCPERQVCIFKTCSPPCAEDVDCSPGSRCLKSGDDSACVGSSAAACAQDDCPERTICRNGECRNACDGSDDCLGGQICRIDVCIGTNATHDPAANGAGGAGGEGGLGAGGNEASGGTGGAAGRAGSGGTGGRGGTGGTGGSGETAGEGGGSGMPCVPRGAEDCLNGVDDDCNGDIDCADSACAGPVECVPEARGAELGIFVEAGTACPTGYEAVDLHTDLQAGFGCPGCSCTPVASRCETGVYAYGANTCPGFQFSGALHNVFSHRCDPLPQDTRLFYYAVRGFTECTPQGVGVPDPASWGENRRFCRADRVGAGCANGWRCVPAQRTPVCSLRAGASSCGGDYPNETGATWYTGFEDARECNCSCGFGSANCSGAYIAAYTQPNCVGTAYQLGNGAEGQSCPFAVTPVSGRVIGTPTAPSCESNTFPIGDLTETGEHTVCCR